MLRLLPVAKTAIYGRDLALSVGVLALTFALQLGTEMRVKEGALPLSSFTGVSRETAFHPRVTLIWHLYLFAIHQGRVFCL